MLAGDSVSAVAAQVGVSRHTLHTWLSRYRDEGRGGQVDRSHRLEFGRHQSSGAVLGRSLNALGTA